MEQEREDAQTHTVFTVQGFCDVTDPVTVLAAELWSRPQTQLRTEAS